MSTITILNNESPPRNERNNHVQVKARLVPYTNLYFLGPLQPILKLISYGQISDNYWDLNTTQTPLSLVHNQEFIETEIIQRLHLKLLRKVRFWIIHFCPKGRLTETWLLQIGSPHLPWQNCHGLLGMSW